MKSVVYWLIALMVVTSACFAERNGVRGGGWSEPLWSDTVAQPDSDGVIFMTSMTDVSFFSLALVLDSTSGENDSISAKYRVLRRTSDSSLAIGTPLTPILWQSGEFASDTTRWIGDFRDNSLWWADIPPYVGEAIQIWLYTVTGDEVPYIIELMKTDGQ